MAGRPLLAISFLVLLAACSGEPRTVVAPGAFTGVGGKPVFIVNHGWHTGVMVEAPAAQQRIPHLAERFGDISWLEFGWGDRDFYEADSAGALDALRAIFPGESVVHVVGLHHLSSSYLTGAGLVRLCVTEAELTALLDFLVASFEVDPEGVVLPRGRSQAMGQFYNGAGRYHLAQTCNVWTARALQSIGMELSSRRKLTAGSVMSYLEGHPAAEVLRRAGAPRQLRATAVSCP